MFASTTYTVSPSGRGVAAIVLSILVHAAVLAGWRIQVISLPELTAFEPIQVQLVAESTPRPTERPRPVARAEPPPTPAARPTPAPTADSTPAPPQPTSTPATPLVTAPSESANTASATQDSIVEARADVASLNNPKPPYPLTARRQGVEGEVLLSVHVSREGSPSDVQLKRSSGHRMLDMAALETVRRWHFVPARRGAMVVDSDVDVPIRFRIER